MTRTLFSFACHAYAVAGAAYLLYLVRQRGWSAAFGALALFAGFVAHAGVILGRYQALEGSPVSTWSDGLSFVTWLTVGAYLALDRVYGLPALGAFVTPLALMTTTTALMAPMPLSEGPAILGLPGIAAHVTVAFLGIALSALATASAGAYVLLERQMKFKRFGFFFTRLPSLEVLDDLNRKLVTTGFVLLSVTILSGVFFARARHDGASLDPAEALTLGAWVVHALLIAARLQGGWRGRRVAMLTLAGFTFLIGSFAGLFGFPGRHGRALIEVQGRMEAPHG
jgi:ABC-type uncharacterized transport system permease subunit